MNNFVSKFRLLTVCFFSVLSFAIVSNLGISTVSATPINTKLTVIRVNFENNFKITADDLFTITNVTPVKNPPKPMDIMKTSNPKVSFVVAYAPDGQIENVGINFDTSLSISYAEKVYGVVLESLFLYPSAPKSSEVEAQFNALHIRERSSRSVLFTSPRTGDVLMIRKDYHQNILTLSLSHK